jgi:hypothetical protein
MSKIAHVIAALVFFYSGLTLLEIFEAGTNGTLHLFLAFWLGGLVVTQLRMLITDAIDMTNNNMNGNF